MVMFCRCAYNENANMHLFRAVFWVVLPCKKIVVNIFTRQYKPEDSSEHHTRRRENLKSHKHVPISFAVCMSACKKCTLLNELLYNLIFGIRTGGGLF
jgi:hypothetical protein